MSITWKLLLSYLLVVLVAVGSLGLYLGHETERDYVSSLENGLAAQAALIADELHPERTAPAQIAAARSIVSRAATSSGARVTLIASDGTVVADSEHDHVSPAFCRVMTSRRAPSIRVSI